MKVTIIPEDGAVSVDGIGFGNLDLSSLDPSLHAVQWYDTYGEVEFKGVFADGKTTKPENHFITSFAEYEPVLALWQAAAAAAEAAEAAAAAAAAEAALAADQPVSTGVQEL